MKFCISEERIYQNFGVFWITADFRLMILWYNKYEDAKKQYRHLKKLDINSSLVARLSGMGDI